MGASGADDRSQQCEEKAKMEYCCTSEARLLMNRLLLLYAGKSAKVQAAPRSALQRVQGPPGVEGQALRGHDGRRQRQRGQRRGHDGGKMYRCTCVCVFRVIYPLALSCT